MNPALALDDLPKRLQLKIASRWRTAFLAEATPFAIVLPRGGESVFVKHRNAHPGLREARVFLVAPVGLLHIFAKRELDARRGGLELECLRPLAKAQLDDRVLTADRVSRAVQQVGHGQATGELAINLRRLGVDDVADRDHCRRGQGAFVDRAENHAVVVSVDNAGGDVPALGIDHVGVFGWLNVAADFFDLAVNDQEVVLFQDAAFATGPKRRVADEHGGRLEQSVFAERRAGEALVRLVLFFIVRFFAVFFLFVVVFLFVDPREFLRLERVPSALDPNALELGLGVEVIALDDDEVGQFAGFDRTELVGDTCQCSRRGGECGESVALGQASLDDLGQVLAELLFVLEAVSRESDFEAVILQQNRVFRRPVPGTEQVERDVFPVGVARHLGHLGQVDRHDKTGAARFHEVWPPPFVAGRDDDRLDAELIGEPYCLVHHQHAARLDDDQLLVIQNSLKCLERFIVRRPLGGVRVGSVVVPDFAVMLSVGESLPDCRDDAHERLGELVRLGCVRVENDVLKKLRLDDELVRRTLAKRDEGALAANDAVARREHGGGEALCAQCLVGARLRAECLGDIVLRFHRGQAGAGAGRAGVKLVARRAEKPRLASGGRASAGDALRHRGRDRLGLGDVWVDESGVKRQAGHVPLARRVGGLALFGDSLDAAIADDHRGVVDRDARLDDDRGVDQRVVAGREGAVARWQDFSVRGLKHRQQGGRGEGVAQFRHGRGFNQKPTRLAKQNWALGQASGLVYHGGVL